MTALICTRPDCVRACDRCLAIRRKSRDELERALAEALACADALVAVVGDLVARYSAAIAERDEAQAIITALSSTITELETRRRTSDG